jgi:hypothetical protein
MAKAGASYTWGRESASQHGETLASLSEQMVDRGAPDGARSADEKVEAYNFACAINNEPCNQVPLVKSLAYDPRHYEQLALLLQAKRQKDGRSPRFVTSERNQ